MTLAETTKGHWPHQPLHPAVWFLASCLCSDGVWQSLSTAGILGTVLKYRVTVLIATGMSSPPSETSQGQMLSTTTHVGPALPQQCHQTVPKSPEKGPQRPRPHSHFCTGTCFMTRHCRAEKGSGHGSSQSSSTQKPLGRKAAEVVTDANR